MIRTRVVLVCALVLAALSCGEIVYLQHHMRVSEDARIAVMKTERQLNALQGPPWEVMNPGYGTVKQIRAQVASGEQQLQSSVVALKRSYSAPGLDGLAASLARNFASLDLIMKLGVQEGWRNVASTNAASQQESVSLASATQMLEAADRTYAGQAHFSARMASAGAVAAIVLLFLAFAVFFLRSRTTQRRLEDALSGLSRAQDERGRLLARTVEVAEHERIRVATDLHDGPIQQLTALVLTIDRLNARLSRGDFGSVAPLMSEVRISLAREMDALRRLMVELRPPLLSERGLAAALSDLAESVFAEEPTQCTIDCDLDGNDLAPELETVVYRVVSEALVNVRKHATASRVDVAVKVARETLSLSIVDNGNGFTAASANGNSSPNLYGYGLVGIRERVEGLGGSVAIETGDGRGVRIECVLPLRSRAHEGAEREPAAA